MSGELSLYDYAREALRAAVKVDDVKNVRNEAERLRLYARQAKDKGLMADATELKLRAERRLGQMLEEAHRMGLISVGGRPRAKETSSSSEPVFEESMQPFSLKDAGIDKKLSMKAQAWAKLGDPDFEAKLQEVRNKIEASGATIVNPAKDLSTADKKARREQRESDLGAKQRALPDRQYGVILADPEWKFDTYSAAGLDRSADNHYPTSTVEAIKARDVASIAAKDAVLFLWATAPMLPQALEVMSAWGFAYKSQAIWRKAEAISLADPVKGIQSGAKVILGTGYWFRNGHELLLVGTRGDLPAPAMGNQWASILDAPPRRHSEKPTLFYELIEDYFPTLPKIELNARQARDGWDAWGNEAPEQALDPAAATTLPAGETSSVDTIQTAGQTVDQGEGAGFASRFLAEISGIRQGEPVDAAGEVRACASPAVAILPEAAPSSAATFVAANKRRAGK